MIKFSLILINTIKDFLDYFGAKKYKTNKGYSVEWIARKI